MARLTYAEKKALTALRTHGAIVCCRKGGRPFVQADRTKLKGFSREDVESLVSQGFAKRTQVVPDPVYDATGPGMGAEL